MAGFPFRFPPPGGATAGAAEEKKRRILCLLSLKNCTVISLPLLEIVLNENSSRLERHKLISKSRALQVFRHSKQIYTHMQLIKSTLRSFGLTLYNGEKTD